jgi:hypothetical protein
VKIIKRRNEHERTGSTKKVRALKHRRSRSTHKLTWDHHGKHARREAAWKRERRRGLNRHSSESMQRIVITTTVPETHEYVHFYDDHSPFKFRDSL